MKIRRPQLSTSFFFLFCFVCYPGNNYQTHSGKQHHSPLFLSSFFHPQNCVRPLTFINLSIMCQEAKWSIAAIRLRHSTSFITAFLKLPFFVQVITILSPSPKKMLKSSQKLACSLIQHKTGEQPVGSSFTSFPCYSHAHPPR